MAIICNRFVLLPSILAIITMTGCDPKKSDEYKNAMIHSASLQKSLQDQQNRINEMQVELTKWRADDAANFKQLREALDKMDSDALASKLIEEIEQFLNSFPKSNLLNDAKTLKKLAMEKRGLLQKQEDAKRQASVERDRLMNAPELNPYNYSDNPTLFDRTHRGKLVRVTGTAEYIGYNYVMKYGGAGGSVMCYFDAPMTTINKGQKFDVVGVYVGLEEDSKFLTLKVTGCQKVN
jgi:hypothetical protein